MVLWSLLQTFWIPVALWLFRNGLSLYRQLRATYASNTPNIHPCSPTTQRALNVLFFSAFLCLLYTFQPPANIFKETSSRLQTPPDVLFARLRNIRTLTPLDEALQDKMKSKESKLLYLAYGPNTVANCAFCVPTEPMTYLIYALPSILSPHLLHAAVLGAVTSTLLAGPEASRCRSHIILTVLGLAAGEAYLTATYDISANVRATRGSELDFFHDKMHLYRSLSFIAADFILSGVLWLSSTGRLFVRPLTVGERLHNLIQSTETGAGRLWATAAITNAVSRDENLRQRWGGYWTMEKEVQEDQEVLESERKALSRIDTRQLNLAADKRTEDVQRILNSTLGMQSLPK